MTENKKKYLKYYLLVIAIISIVFLLLKNISTGADDILTYSRLADLIIAASISMYIYYNGREEGEGVFKSFCHFECNQNRDKVDIFYTYIMAVPTFLYILGIFTFKDKIPSFLFSFTAVVIVLFLSSFIGYKICYYNKGIAPVLKDE